VRRIPARRTGKTRFMLNDFSFETRFVLCALALWRVTHLFVAEDGPWDVIVRLRVRLGDSQAGRAMDCFYCLSLWLAILFTFAVASHLLSWIISWLSLSATASLLEQATNPNINQPRAVHRRTEKN
jgi:hypothetical protein